MKRFRIVICSLLVVFMLTGLFVTLIPDTSLNAKSSDKFKDVTVSLKGAKIEAGTSKKLVLKVKESSDGKWIKGKTLTKKYGKITWSSSNKNVATVSANGTVTGIKKGTVTITAKTKKGLKATCKVKVKASSNGGLKKITLSGNAEDHVLIDGYSYIEGDKFFLLLEKDLDIPGDFADNVAMIIDTLEEKTGLTYGIVEKYEGLDNVKDIYGFDPWESLKFGNKIPIYVMVDREDVGYISCASYNYVILFIYELFSEDFWNSIPSYRDNGWRRRDFMDYFCIAHELTHILMLNYTNLSDIMSEGSADYFAIQTLKALTPKVPEFKTVLDNSYIDYYIPVEITSENAEEVFLEDFAYIDHADRGAEYALGRHICTYLAETYGDMFMRDYIFAVKDSGFDALMGLYTDADRKLLTDTFKKVFGKNVFKKFGKWFSELERN